MTDELARVREHALILLREGYLEALDSPANLASMQHVAPKLGLDPDNWEQKREFRKLAQYLASRGYIKSEADGFGLFSILPAGRALVEGDEPQQAQVTSHTYIGGNAYGSVFGSQNVDMNVSFDMRTVEAEINQAEQTADQRGGPDAAEIKELLAELRAHLQTGEPIEPGKLARWGRVFRENGWLSGPVIGALLNYAFRTATGT